ncbi:proteoglycan 4-like [Fopius arisanus]|uniref:Proteoglycan 4-like n=1 Tax=Fopius arisanus TaxID=64838 RepID=A0A9R1TPF6_9HYME|nr:PREDICTED: proteoglycan 4-like [Fopius arisanus]
MDTYNVAAAANEPTWTCRTRVWPNGASQALQLECLLGENEIPEVVLQYYRGLTTYQEEGQVRPPTPYSPSSPTSVTSEDEEEEQEEPIPDSPRSPSPEALTSEDEEEEEEPIPDSPRSPSPEALTSEDEEDESIPDSPRSPSPEPEPMEEDILVVYTGPQSAVAQQPDDNVHLVREVLRPWFPRGTRTGPARRDIEMITID